MSPTDTPTGASGRPLRGAHAVVVNWRDLEHRLAGGSERYAWEFAQALREAGARVEFLTARDRGQSRSEVREGIEIHRAGGAFTFYAFAGLALLRRRRTLDVVIDPECGIPSFSPLYVARSTAVVLVVHHVHQEQFTTYFPAPLARLGQWLEAVAMPWLYRGRRTVAVSSSTHEEMVAQLGWSGPVSVIANGTAVAQTPTECPADEVVEGAARTGTGTERVVVLGRLVPHKRVDLVLRTLHDLRDERPGLHLDICGKGPELERLQRMAADLDLTSRVSFHGYVTEQAKAELLTRAALHVCASDIEGWGQVVIEAAGHGVPTLARDVPGLRDSIRDGDTGFLVPDAADLDEVQERLTAAARTVLSALEQPDHRRSVSRAARAWAAGFSWSRMRQEAVDLVVDELSWPHDPQVRSHPRSPSHHHAPSSSSAALAATTER